MRFLLVAVILSGLGAQAIADTEADKLFQEALALKEAGKAAEACAKFEQALSSNNNAVGTLLNVAKCDEDAGRIATAVKRYSQARDIAREHSMDEHRTAAEGRIAAIGDRVPRLTVAFTERLEGMKLVIDDEVVPSDAETTNELRLDPGTRHIVVTAPGRLPYSVNVELKESKLAVIAIPKLGHPVTVTKARRTVGKILTFSGAALAGTGVLLGWIANRDYEAYVGPSGSMKACTQESPSSTPLCNAEGYQHTGEARQLGLVGSIVGIGGLAALGLGVVLWFTAPQETAQRISVVPAVTSDSAGIAAVGRF